jgi:hypothetical protein
MTTIEDIMRMDDTNMKNLPWNKLDRYLKLNKLYDYVKDYQIQHTISDESAEQLM